MQMKPLLKNIIMVYRELMRQSVHMRWQMPLYAFFRVVSPLIKSAVPALVIALLTRDNFIDYVAGISAVLLVSVFLASGIIIFEDRWSMDLIRTRLSGFTTRMLHKSLTMDYCNLEPADKQKKMGRGAHAVFSNAAGVEGLTRYSFDLFCAIFGVVSYGAVMANIHWSILLIVAVTNVVTFLLTCHAVNFGKSLGDEKYPAWRVNRMLEKQGISLEYGKDIRIYHVENWFGKIFDEQIGKLYRCFKRQELRWYFPTVAEQVGTVVRDIVMYLILIRRVLDGQMSAALFTFYVGVVAGFSAWTNDVIFRISRVLQASAEVEYYHEAMATPDVFPRGEGKKPDLKAGVSLEFRDVSFRYEEAGEDVLSHLSFRIEPGQKIALVGNNGAGKTTIVKLICGFYLPTEGDVLVNGISTREYDMDEYGKLISPVFQDGFLSAFSVALNVAGGDEEDIDRERVRKCLKQADVWEKIDSLAQKEDTPVTQVLDESGVSFSGGEVQKILIARALYKDAGCLILDEPTSALDPIAESQIYKKYNEMTRKKTSIFISHRLASTRFCDEILYLENGRVAERGTHEKLLEKRGRYAELFEIQSHYYKEKEGA